MRCTLRNFENNLQIVNSLGWIFILLSIVMAIVQGKIVLMFFAIFGIGMVWVQLRGKRITVDTKARTIFSAGWKHEIKQPEKLFMNRIRVAQRVNSRVQSTNVKSYFFKAYLQDDGKKILLSSNQSESRDMEKLKTIAEDLGIDFSLNY